MRRFVFCLARLAFSLIFVVIAMPCVAFATNDIGKVIMFTPGATVLRDGKTEALALHAGIQVQDTLQTDAVGRVKVLFNDDSSVSLGPNTTMDMNEFADAGGKSAFSVNVPQGMIRAITGKIVDQNPDGFKMTSPEATVGIRGTIVTMHVHRGQGGRMRTTVYVENTLRRVYVNSENVPSGTKWIREGGASRQERISPEDRRHIGKELAFRGGGGVAAAAPEATGERGKRSPSERFAADSQKTLLPPDTALKDIALGTQKLGDSLGGNLLLASSTPMGHVAGILGSLTNSISGTFSFDVNLSSGAMSNGKLDLSGTLASLGGPTPFVLGGTTVTATAVSSLIVNLSNGTGSINPLAWSMDTFGSGLLTIDGVSCSPIPSQVSVSGLDPLMSASAGPLTTPGYQIVDNAVLPQVIDSGQGSATFTK